MSTLPQEAKAVRPVGSFSRVALAVIAPIGPLAIGAGVFLWPYSPEDETVAWVPKVAANQPATDLLLWLGQLSSLTILVGVLVTGFVARRGSTVLGTVGLALSFVGFSALVAAGPGSDAVALAGTRTGLDATTTAKLVDEWESVGAVSGLGFGVFLLTAAGLVVTGIALWRGRTVPLWVGIALAVSMPLTIVGWFSGLALVIAGGYALMALGFGFAGAAYARSA